MKRHLQCAEQQASPSNVTKYCACHVKRVSSLILVTYETSFTMRGATSITLQPHQMSCRQNSIAAKWNIFLSFGLKVPFGFPCLAHVCPSNSFGFVFFSQAHITLVVALLFGGLVLLLAFLQGFIQSVFVPPLQHGQTSSWKGLHVSMTGRAVFLTLPLPRDCIVFSQFKSRLLPCGVLEIAAFPFCELWSFILNVKLQLVVLACIAKDPVTNLYTSTRILAENSFKAIASVDLTIEHREHLCRWPFVRQVRHLDNPLWTIRISFCFLGRCFLQAPNNVVFILCEEVCLHTGLFQWRN